MVLLVSGVPVKLENLLVVDPQTENPNDVKNKGRNLTRQEELDKPENWLARSNTQ